MKEDCTGFKDISGSPLFLVCHHRLEVSFTIQKNVPPTSVVRRRDFKNKNKGFPDEQCDISIEQPVVGNPTSKTLHSDESSTVTISDNQKEKKCIIFSSNRVKRQHPPTFRLCKK